MSDRFRASQASQASQISALPPIAAVVIVLALLIPASATAQAKQPSSKSPAQTSIKKTPDGQPDLQGFWSSQTTTPLERPANCGTKEFWTDEEMAKGVRTCTAPAAAGQRGAAPAEGARGQRGRGQRATGEVDPHYDLAQFGLNLR